VWLFSTDGYFHPIFSKNMRLGYRIFVSAKRSLNVFQAGDMLKQTHRHLVPTKFYHIQIINATALKHFSRSYAFTNWR
jgi:hypothetical protein